MNAAEEQQQANTDKDCGEPEDRNAVVAVVVDIGRVADEESGCGDHQCDSGTTPDLCVPGEFAS